MNIKLVEQLRQLKEEDLFPNASEEEVTSRKEIASAKRAAAEKKRKELEAKLPELAKQAADKVGAVILRAAEARDDNKVWVLRIYKVYRVASNMAVHVSDSYNKEDADRLLAALQEFSIDKNFEVREDTHYLRRDEIADILNLPELSPYYGY